MTTHHPSDDERLVGTTRNFVSRHQDIPPTPRDTMALLMQAAEQARDTASRPVLRFPLLRWAAAACVCAALALFALNTGRIHGTNENKVTTLAQAIEADIGIDVAAWDMEVAALFDELDEAIVSLNTEEPWP